MHIIFRFTIAGLLLVLAIFSILLWKRSLVTIDLLEGGSIVATAYDFEPIVGQFKIDRHVAILSDKAIQNWVAKSSDLSGLVKQLRLMPEYVQSRFLTHLSSLDEKQINSILRSNQGFNHTWIKLISYLRRENSKLKQEFIKNAKTYHRDLEKATQTGDTIEISKTLPGLNIDDIGTTDPDIYEVLFSINVDKIQSDMDQENKLEAEIEQKESLIVRLKSECSSLENENKKLENTNRQLKEILGNLKEFSQPISPSNP